MQTQTLPSTGQTTDSIKRPPLSIVVATTKPWPEVRACLDSLMDQATTVSAEILVADGDGRGLPDEGKSVL
jgi:hypothetical protein